MYQITIKSTPKGVSKEFVSSWVHATVSVLALHNKPLEGAWTVRAKDLSKRRNNVVPGAGVGGYCSPARKEIVVGYCFNNNPEGVASAIVHELIHATFGDFGSDTNEKCTSTLTSKLLPVIHPIVEHMMGDYYRVKAYIAHTKPGMAYPTKNGGKDSYDLNQWKAAEGVKDSRKKEVDNER